MSTEPTEPLATTAAANRRSVRRLLAVVVGMFGFGFLMVPFYDVICDITGLNGKTRNSVADAAPVRVDASRTVTVEFVASVNADAPWEFRPDVVRLDVHPGQFYQTHFYARNLQDRPLVAQAIPSVAPGLAATYFQKIECFCFNRQAFAAGEGREMPVTFRLDPALPADTRTVTLSYTLFRAEGQGG